MQHWANVKIWWIKLKCRVVGGGASHGSFLHCSRITWITAGLMSDQRLRRWPNKKSALGQCVVFANISPGRDCWTAIQMLSTRESFEEIKYPHWTLWIHLYEHCLYDYFRSTTAYPRRLTNVWIMLVQRRRRWANINQAFVSRVMLAGWNKKPFPYDHLHIVAAIWTL